MKKHIAGALVASLLIGSVPVWASENPEGAPVSTTQTRAHSSPFHDSIERAIGRAVSAPAVAAGERAASGAVLTAQERQDLERRSAALGTDPVARGGGGILLALLGIAISVAVTIWAIDHFKNDEPKTEMARH